MVLLASPLLRRLLQRFSVGEYHIEGQRGLFQELFISDIYNILGEVPRRERKNGHRNG
jgi:hypothetical protein